MRITSGYDRTRPSDNATALVLAANPIGVASIHLLQLAGLYLGGPRFAIYQAVR